MGGGRADVCAYAPEREFFKALNVLPLMPVFWKLVIVMHEESPLSVTILLLLAPRKFPLVISVLIRLLRHQGGQVPLG